MQENIISLEEVKSHFQQWRMTRTKRREKIPEHLWEMVKQIIDNYSMMEITASLGINKYQIKDNLKFKPIINFVEARADMALIKEQKTISSPDNETICAVELHRTNGCILKINALPLASINAIINQFMA